MPTFSLLGLVATAALFSTAVLGGAAVTLAVVLVVQTVLLLAWSRLSVPAAAGGAVLAGAACVVADVLAFRTTAAGDVATAGVAVAGIAVLLALAHQLARRDGRPQVTVSLAAALGALLVALPGAAWVGVARDDAGLELAMVLAVSAVLGGLAGASARARPWAGLLGALVLGAGAGAVLGVALDLPLVRSVTAGLVGALAAMATLQLTRFVDDRRIGGALAATVPLVLAGPLVLALLQT